MRTALFNDTHQRFRADVRAFVERKLKPHASKWERVGRFPRTVLEEFGQRGWLALDPQGNAVLAEELPRSESLGLALSVFVQSNLIAPLLAELGTKSQQEIFLPPLRRGKIMGAMAVSEPATGSDFAALQSTAQRKREHLVVNGVKTYITNGACADFLIVAARTRDEPGLGALSLLLISTATPGVRVKRLATLGLNSSAMGEIMLRNVRVPRSSLLGDEGAAFSYVQQALNRERLFGGLACVAWADYAMEKTVAFARQRQAFGKSLTRFQAIRHQFAEMATTLEAARQLNYAALNRWIAGKDATKEIGMVKLFSYQTAQQVIERCLQLHGGAGYLADHWISRFYRDARALTIAAGTPEIMKELIAAYLRL
ncbi:MAG: acyl-CoA dehydrogenase family protein [Verrucomicrobia bacterium]|nr:acyl-CoA dehydrogenase family protein [Verrucomicrobiota bacterium]